MYLRFNAWQCILHASLFFIFQFMPALLMDARSNDAFDNWQSLNEILPAVQVAVEAYCKLHVEPEQLQR